LFPPVFIIDIITTVNILILLLIIIIIIIIIIISVLFRSPLGGTQPANKDNRNRKTKTREVKNVG